MKNNIINLPKSLIVPTTVAILAFVLVRPAVAQLAQEQQEFVDYINSNDVEVGSEVVDGFNRVYYLYQGDKRYITSDGINAIQPDSKREYIAYVAQINGQGQIFLHNLLTNQSSQLSFSSTNLEPKVDINGNIAWEGWEKESGKWQVFIFDGTKVAQLTTGDLSMNPDIEDKTLVYSRKDSSGFWRAVLYSLDDEKTIDITLGDKARAPKLVNGEIYLAGGQDKFSLTAEDLYLLDLPSLTSTSSTEPEELSEPETVTSEDILEEFEEVETTESTSSATTHIQESSSSGQLEVQ
jgi:hypothetical protein